MEIPTTVWFAAIAVTIIIVVFLRVFALRARSVNLIGGEGENIKHDWLLRAMPAESLDAQIADGDEISLFDFDPGEELAAPFAEQIEDVLRAVMRENPELTAVTMDFGSMPDGGLAIWIDGECYTDLASLPSDALRQALRDAVKRWETSLQ